VTLTPRIALALSLLTLAAAPAAAVPLDAGALDVKQAAAPGVQAEHVRYVRHRRGAGVPGAGIGGLLAGVVGGAAGGGCYFNDCGYDY
jgi:hypothetical protein